MRVGDVRCNLPKQCRHAARLLSLCALWISLWLASGGYALAGGVPDAAATTVQKHPELNGILAGPDSHEIATGILYDRVLPLSRIERVDGTEASEPVSPARWRQMYHEITRASIAEPTWPSLEAVLLRAGRLGEGGVIPVVIMNFSYNRIRADAVGEVSSPAEGARSAEDESKPYLKARVFAAAPMRDYTHRGYNVIFALDDRLYFTNDRTALAGLEIDFADGLGFRPVAATGRAEVSYRYPGPKLIRLKVEMADGTVRFGSFNFSVKALVTPDPHDTLAVTATIPYNGAYAGGEAYIYLSDLHTSLTNPVVVIEGFDIDNTMNWDELYSLLNQEGLVDTLRGRGYDAVVLNFTDATDYIQRNAFVITELIDQVNIMLGPGVDIAVVGASMGGLAGRYALAYMETWGLDHNCRTFISFDSPQNGANIPLGVQYWVLFFSSESASADSMLTGLNTPAARQLLVYHLTDPPGTTGESDPLRVDLISDLASVGDYPAGLRTVAVANGSGQGFDQGFTPGDQLILYEYNSLLVDIRGNVWAVPDASNGIIFHGLMDLIWPLPDREMNVYVEGTRPFDGAPGGWRSSMAQMDSTEAPYGDIIALQANHCFIPTISALALDTEDLFYDIAGDPDLLAHTVFDTVYFPAENQEHVLITPENAQWLVAEIERGACATVATPPDAACRITLEQARPNPFTSSTTIRFSLPHRQHARLEIFDVLGRQIDLILDGILPAGRSEAVWDGRDGRGLHVAPGIYLCRLSSQAGTRSVRTVFLR